MTGAVPVKTGAIVEEKCYGNVTAVLRFRKV